MSKYFYLLNYPPVEKDFCRMEMNALFNKRNDDKYIFSDKYINPSTSPFIKEMISILYTGDTLDNIIENIKGDSLTSQDFKVIFLKFDVNEARHSERMNAVHLLGKSITGFPDLHNPKEIFAVTKIEGKWIFGIFSKNDFSWHKFDVKPYSYSNSLSVKVSRSLCNIASKGNKDCAIVDPCCGVGTVILNGVNLGLNIKGFELSAKVASNARDNLEHFGYERYIIQRKDMLTIDEHFDVAILDLPYGLFTTTTKEDQKSLISKCNKIADKLILITSIDMSTLLNDCNFKIVESCIVHKNNFKRYIYISHSLNQ